MTTMLHAALRSVRTRAMLGVAIVGVGIACAAAALAWRGWGSVAAVLVALAVVVAGAFAAHLVARRYDMAWLLGEVDARRRDLEDSTGLLLASPTALGPLQLLQRERVIARLRERPLPDLRRSWPWRGMVAAWLLALLAISWALAWPQHDDPVAGVVRDARPGTHEAEAPRLLAQVLQVQPPAYTGQEASRSDVLDAKVPAGSRLQWTLRFNPQPAEVALVTHDDKRLQMRRDGDDWRVDAVIDASLLYRVVAAGEQAQGKLHRIDAVPDTPPRISVRIPERSLTITDPPPRAWLLSFDVEDDHGVSADARLLLTRTEGTGENIRFHEHVLTLRGSGERRVRRFEVRVDPASYGLQRGEDLIARLEVGDNHTPQPQLARSASVILRWPERTLPGAEGLEAMARQVLPAYFRSQRQIIIDAEALLKEKPRLSEDQFAMKSDAIGVDQRLLRLRYGQFLGEESEGGAKPPPTNDLPTNDGHEDDAGHGDDDHAHGAQDADAHDGHDHGAQPTGEEGGGFGRGVDVLETFGHTHDLPEAATLLAPKTREILRKALREMWQSELHLRQAVPQQALPYAYRALELIKQVQQADRIYLQRVGRQLPPIDESRRMGGKRDGIQHRPLSAAEAKTDLALAATWAALGNDDAVAGDTLDALQAWADANGARIQDPLALIAALDALRSDPGCGACREELRTQVWKMMRRPDGGIERRDDGDARGRRYLELLGGARP